MLKYHSKYTSEQFEEVIDLLENTWIQLQISGGNPGTTIKIVPGDTTVVHNLIVPGSIKNSQWYTNNADTVELLPSGIVYPNFTEVAIRSNYDGSYQAVSKYYYTFSAISGHKYYFYAVADGIQANESLKKKEYNNVINTYGIAIENASSIIASDFKQDLLSHELSCIATASSSSQNYKFSIYANNSSTPSDAIVYFGCMSAIDLTADFGEGNEPSKEWCDSNLKFYDALKHKDVIFLTDQSIYPILEGTFNTSGECLLSLPGFGEYRPCVINNISEDVQTTTYYEPIVINKIKRYFLDLGTGNLT